MEQKDLITYLKIKKELRERIYGILKYFPDRYDEHFSCCATGGGIEVPALPIEHWQIWPDYGDEGTIVYVTLGAPSGYEGESVTHFSIDWILDDEIYGKKCTEFKKKFDKLHKRVNKEYVKEKKVDEYKEKLENELKIEREKKLKEFEEEL